MAFLKFLKGNYADMTKASVVEGQVLICGDTGEMFVDVDASNRVKIGDFVTVPTIAALEAIDATTVPTSRLYYVADSNILARSNGTIWVQINKDTGATSVEITGEGNGITGASYDPQTRKITFTKGETFATKKQVDDLTTYVGTIPTDDKYADITNVIAYVNKKSEETLAAAQGGSSETAASVKQQLDNYKDENNTRVKAAEDAITAIKDGTAVDSFADVEAELAKKVDKVDGKSLVADTEITKLAGVSEGANKVEASETNGKIKIDGVETTVYTHPAEHAISEVTGLQAVLDAKVVSVTASDASVTVGGTATAPTVAAKLSADADNALELAEDGLKVVIPAAAEYTIEKAAESGDYAAVYALKKDGVQVGASINIPKDMVVESGAVVENPEGQDEGTYIELKLQNVTNPLYINVGSLIEYVTSGSAAGDMVVITVSDDHKVTATITDGTVTLAKLDTETQTKINKAHSHENATVLDGITADKVAAWDAAEKNAKDHADGLNTAMNTRVEALEAIDHDHANKAELDLIATGDKAKWDAAADKAHTHENAEELAKIADGDVAKWNAAQANAEATAAAALATARTEISAEIDEDVKALADGQVKTNTEAIATNAAAITSGDAATLAAAKEYVDTALTWGSFAQ